MQMFAGLVDDLQYVPEMGLRPILNNLTMITPKLAIAAIGFEMLTKHGKAFVDYVTGKEPFKTAAEQMEELGKKTARTADESKRLLQYTREKAIIEEQQGKVGHVQEEMRSRVGTAIGEFGPAKLKDAMIEDRTPGGFRGKFKARLASENVDLAKEYNESYKASAGAASLDRQEPGRS